MTFFSLFYLLFSLNWTWILFLSICQFATARQSVLSHRHESHVTGLRYESNIIYTSIYSSILTSSFTDGSALPPDSLILAIPHWSPSSVRFLSLLSFILSRQSIFARRLLRHSENLPSLSVRIIATLYQLIPSIERLKGRRGERVVKAITIDEGRLSFPWLQLTDWRHALEFFSLLFFLRLELLLRPSVRFVHRIPASFQWLFSPPPFDQTMFPCLYALTVIVSLCHKNKRSTPFLHF